MRARVPRRRDPRDPGRARTSPRAPGYAAFFAGLIAIAAILAPLTTPGGGPVARAADPDPLLEYLQAAAAANGQHVEVTGALVRVTDGAGDVDGAPGSGTDDIVAAGYAWLPQIPPEMLHTWLACTEPTNFCAKAGSDDASFADGLWIFWAEMAKPYTADAKRRAERGPILRQKTYATAPAQAGQAFGGASHAVIGRDDRGTHDQLLFAYTNAFNPFRTRSRSRWDGEYVFVAVPKLREVQTDIIGWDFYSYSSDGTPAGTGRDTLRGLGGAPLLGFNPPPTFEFKEGLASAAPSAAPSASPSAAPSAAPSPSPSAPASVTPSASTSVVPSPSSAPSSAGGGIVDGPLLPVIAIVAGLGLILLGSLALFGRRGRPEGGTAAGGVVVAVASDDPCPPLIAAAKAAQAACEEAIRAASAAADAAKARAAEAEAARQALEKARAAREEAERELEKRRQPPDPGQRLGSTSFGGRDVHVDQYDLWLQEQARAAANAAHKAAHDAATTDAERQQADEDWMKELDSVDGADGLDEVRRRDKTGREKWIKEAEAGLKAAQEAEAAAQAEATRTAEAADAAKAEAAAASGRADDACAKAKVAAAAAADCIKLQTPVVPDEADVPPPPPPPPPTPPPPPPPTPPSPPTPPPKPPTPPTQSRDCPEDSEPRITTKGTVEVDLYIISEARLKISGYYLFGDDEAAEAIRNLEDGLAGANLVTNLIGAVTDPVMSIVGTVGGWIGVPSFDTVTNAPTDAAIKALDKLREQLKEKRRVGTWMLDVPRQHFRFSCRVTETCVGGQWVVTGRDFVGERVGSPTYEPSIPVEVLGPADEVHAWVDMSRKFVDKNRVGEQAIEAAARACAAD